MTVVNSTPQGLWLGHVLARYSESSRYETMAAPTNWHDTPGEYFECTRKLTTTKSIKAKQQHSINKLTY